MKRAARAFSLVEVILAIGIASFCLLAILGFFSVAFQAGQQARDTMVVAGGSAGLMNEIRGRTNYFPTNVFFDIQGQRLATSNGAYYECRVTNSQVTQFADTGTSFTQVTMTFTWPVAVPIAQRKNSNNVTATLP